MASLIKVILALQHQALPPHLHLQQLNPDISLEAIPAKIPTRLTPWPVTSEPRLAGINAFGMSGTNAHAVVEAAPAWPASENDRERPLHILALSAKTPRALRDLIARYEQTLTYTTTERLADLCFTAGAGRSHFEHRLAVVGDTPASIRQQLAAYQAAPAPLEPVWAASPNAHPPKIVFVFTEATWPQNAGRRLYDTQPTFRQTIDRCAALLQPEFVPPSEGYPLQQLQPNAALVVLNYALATLWQTWGIVPDGVVGVGVGEVVAACVAGIISVEAALRWATQSEQGGARSPYEIPTPEAIHLPPPSTCAVLCAQTGQPLSPTDVLNRLNRPVQSLLTPQSLHGLATNYTHFLTSFAQPADGGEAGVWLSSLAADRADWDVLLSSLGQLYQQGAAVDWVGFDRDYSRQRLPLPTYPFQRQRYWKPSAERGQTAIAAVPGSALQPHRLSQDALLGLPVEERQPRLVADLCDRLAQLLAADRDHITPRSP
ncbi:MAG: type I polyketide synthase, partial [Leptolyngbyaceae cyanobacterium RM2_2_4]|nr:type I polyketide synthase [Leptolyngbyaceae cyanobacterium RM2_2_4]